MINFHIQVSDFKLKRKKETKEWINKVISAEVKSSGQIDIIFCSDDYLLEINKKYLNHNYLTDIITFNYSDDPEILSGDIYISVDRVKENSQTYDTTFENELNRVIIHGILHLIGYDDTTDYDKGVMKGKEDFYLNEHNGEPL